MLESSGFRKYSTLLVIQLFSPRLCLCHCLCIRLCLCICVPYSFLNSYYHKLSENVWVWGSGASRSGGGEDVTIAGRTNEQKRKDRATQRLPSGSPTSERPTWGAFLRWDFLSPSVIRKSHLNYYVFLHFHSLIWALGVMGHVYQGPSRVRTKKKL